MPAWPPLATVDDVQARATRVLDEAERARAAVLIHDATAMAHARVPALGHPPPATAVGVIATAVLRALETPADGLTTETAGSWSRTAAHDGGGLYLTDDEIDLLRPAEPRSAAFGIWTAPTPG
ncbi:Gp19/Gp15/Gp42 family protein [Saccharopolyspora hattusasensis]|uniref:Gp19/Gp15/Gp42 family protein n=1 Tax=Saccharopolyspora hattusasensis TaxID=1128679 RepID=UPI003D99B2B6